MKKYSLRIDSCLLFAALLLSLIYHYSSLNFALQLMPTDGHTLARQFDRNFIGKGVGFIPYFGMWILGVAGVAVAIGSQFKKKRFPLHAFLLTVTILIANVAFGSLHDRILEIASVIDHPNI